MACIAPRKHLPGRVIGRGRLAKCEPRPIYFAAAHYVFAEPGRGTEADNEYAVSQRIQGAGMPNFLRARIRAITTANGGYDVVAGQLQWFIDVEKTGRDKLAQMQVPSAMTRCASGKTMFCTCSRAPFMVQPDASVCPPPPN